MKIRKVKKALQKLEERLKPYGGRVPSYGPIHLIAADFDSWLNFWTSMPPQCRYVDTEVKRPDSIPEGSHPPAIVMTAQGALLRVYPPTRPAVVYSKAVVTEDEWRKGSRPTVADDVRFKYHR